MTKPSRRDFLKLGAAALGSAALGPMLASCEADREAATAPVASPLPPTSPPTAANLATANTATEPTITPTAVSLPDLAVARNGDPEEMVRRALAALGGMSRFVSKGANVIIKPNICVAYNPYEYAATTNPWVVAALVKLALEAGAGSVKVMDFPFGGTQEAAYEISGIKEQVEAAGGSMSPMPRFKFVSTAIPGGQRLKTVEVFEDVLKADTLINVPIAKVHNLSRLTLGMKNLMGVIYQRQALHGHLAENLADLASLLKPSLTVVDAVRMLVSNGPTGGSLNDVKQMNTIVASPDIVAADSYAATLFGLQPEDLNTIKTAASRGLGRSDLKNLKIEEIQLG